MSTKRRAISGGDFSVEQVQLVSWLLLGAMTLAGWLFWNVTVAVSILVGGLIANLSFFFLKKDLLKLLGGPLHAAKPRFFIRYYVRLAAVAILLFYVVRSQNVQIFGLLAGLSTVFVSIMATVLGAARKVFYKVNVKEAS